MSNAGKLVNDFKYIKIAQLYEAMRWTFCAKVQKNFERLTLTEASDIHI